MVYSIGERKKRANRINCVHQKGYLTFVCHKQQINTRSLYVDEQNRI